MIGERLELFHEEPRNPLHYAFAGVALMGLLSVPTQLVEHYIAPEPEPVVRQAQPSPAPIWSKRCAAQGKGFIAKQADGGKWIVICTTNAIRT